MILGCELCKTRYLVPIGIFAHGPRRVRCVRCKHSWQAELPKEIEVTAPPPPEPAPIPEMVIPIPPGSNLPMVVEEAAKSLFANGGVLLVKIGIITAAIMVFLLIAIFDRKEIATKWPNMENLYDEAGLHIYHFGEGLSFQGVRSEVRYDSGLTQLVVEGTVRNQTTKEQEIPNFLATAIGSDGKTIQSWQIDAPAATVAPAGDAAFHSAITAPKDTVTEINLSFIEPKNDTDK